MHTLTLSKDQWKRFSAGLTSKHRIYSFSYSMGYYTCRLKFVG